MSDVRATSRTLRWSAWGAAVLAALSALVSGYWAAGGTALLALYGGVLTVLGAVAATGILGPPADRRALLWHAFLWDPWFLAWGALLLTAAAARRRSRQRRPDGNLSPAAGRRSAGRVRGPAR